MPISFAERVHRNDRRVKVQTFDFSVDQGALSDFDCFATKRDFIRFDDRTHRDVSKILTKNIGVERTGIEKSLHRLTFDFNCLDYATHGITSGRNLTTSSIDLCVMNLAKAPAPRRPS